MLNKSIILKRFLQESGKGQVLIISSNLRRLSQWAYDYSPNRNKILKTFLEETLLFSKNLNANILPKKARQRVIKKSN